MTDRTVNLRAAALVTAAVSLFALSDAVVKLLTALFPSGQILFCRGILACSVLAVVVLVRQRGRLTLPWRDRWVWARSGFELGVALCYFNALSALPLAEATGVLFVFPILLTALAAFLLKEQVGWQRWSAVAAGLVGVTLIVRPGTAAFEPAALWALAAAVCIAGRDLATRFVGLASGSENIALMTTLLTTTGSLVTLPGGWVALDGLSVLAFATSALLVSGAFLCLVAGTRAGDVSFTAPFRYVTVPLSFVLGFLIWGHVPGALVILGSAIVVGAGLFVLYREQRRRTVRQARPG